LELHIIDFDENIYGQEISVSLLKFIRGVMIFSDVKSLVVQIQKDIEVAKNSI